MSHIHEHALDVAGTVLRHRRGLRGLSPGERREVESLATAVALRVADALARLDSYDDGADQLPEDESGGIAGADSTSRGTVTTGAGGGASSTRGGSAGGSGSGAGSGATGAEAGAGARSGGAAGTTG